MLEVLLTPMYLFLFSLSLLYPTLRVDKLDFNPVPRLLFNKCFFILVDEEHSRELPLIIEYFSKIFNNYPKFSMILFQKEPTNVIKENLENSPVVLAVFKKVFLNT